MNIAISCFYNSFEFVLRIFSNNCTFVALKENFIYIYHGGILYGDWEPTYFGKMLNVHMF